MVLEAQRAVHVDGFMVGRHEPTDRHKFPDGNPASARLVAAVRGSAVHAQLVGFHLPIENDLVGGVANAQVAEIGFGHNGDLDGRVKGAGRNQSLAAGQNNAPVTLDEFRGLVRRPVGVGRRGAPGEGKGQ